MSHLPPPVMTDLESRGYQLTPATAEPTVVATGGRPPDGDVEAPLALISLTEVETTPLAVVARLVEASTRGQRPVFVVDPWTARQVRPLLEPPFLLAAVDDSYRQFYATAERLLLADSSVSCVQTGGPLTWREESTDIDTDGRTGTDSPRLLLEAEGNVVAALESVAALDCPRPAVAAFRHRYARGEDKRIHVFDRDGEVAAYPGIGAMKRDYQPVPVPLVPERRLESGRAAQLARNPLLAVVEDGAVRYDSLDTTSVQPTDE